MNHFFMIIINSIRDTKRLNQINMWNQIHQGLFTGLEQGKVIGSIGNTNGLVVSSRIFLTCNFFLTIVIARTVKVAEMDIIQIILIKSKYLPDVAERRARRYKMKLIHTLCQFINLLERIRIYM